MCHRIVDFTDFQGGKKWNKSHKSDLKTVNGRQVDSQKKGEVVTAVLNKNKMETMRNGLLH